MASNVLDLTPHDPGVPKPDPIMVLDNVRRSFGGLRAVDVDHLEIQRGTITSLIGPNGAGKTTLFNLLSGFDRADEGHWHLDGGALVGIPSFRVARLGVVRTFQLTKSLARLTVLENIEVPLYYMGQLRAEDKQRVLELAEMVGLGDRLDHRPVELSGGQQQRVAIARSMINDPFFILADEPTGNLDSVTAEEILSIFDRLNEEGRTIIMVTHEDEVAHRARRTIRLRDGLIQSDERSRELPEMAEHQRA